MNCSTLAFQDTQFEVIDRGGHPWLRGLQIARALGYKNPSADIQNLYERNADEFTRSMTDVVDLDTAGGRQKVRIFSLRGAHLLAMLSRTKIAKAFRRWVLDVLDREVAGLNQRRQSVPGGVVIASANLELFRQELRELRTVAMSVAGALRPLMGRDGGEVVELWTRAHELPLSWSRLDVGLMSQPVEVPAGPAASRSRGAMPAPAVALTEMDVVRGRLSAWAAAQPPGTKLTGPQVARLALGLGPELATEGDMVRVGKAMKELGWRKARSSPDSGRYWAYQKPRH